MIKLVVCDVDGTLLPRGEMFLSERTINIIKEFNKNNIVFAAASGRQYSELRRIFNNLGDIYYISADGGAVVYNGEVLDSNTIPGFSIRNMINKPNLVFHGVFDSWCTDSNIFDIIKNKYGESAFLIKDNFNNIYNETIKISKYSAAYCEMPQCTYEIYKTREWTDWIKVGAGKEKAIRFIQNKLGIGASETAVFGDGFNDTGMMRCGSMRFVMKNSQLENKVPGNIIIDDIHDELVKIQKG
ncbi:MAG: HAD family hydrolase [Eubacteriales bacterium]|nr:HAD family hydrolase [Eubacteriales bacterium]